MTAKELLIVTITAIVTISFVKYVANKSEQAQQVFVSKVVDGDTFDVYYHNETKRVRLAAIDAPEIHQKYGDKAKHFTDSCIYGKYVTLQITGTDKYGRTVALVWFEGKLLQEQLLRAGLCWHYNYFDKTDYYNLFQALQDSCKKFRVGLFSAENWETPEDFRKLNNQKP